jgi:hypothetical protein
MKLRQSLLAISLLSFWLPGPFAHAQFQSRQSEESSLANAKGALSTITITPLISPAGAGTTSGGGTKDVDKPVTLTAKAKAGAVFVNWTTNGVLASTNKEYKFTADTAIQTVVANFDWVVATKSSPAAGGTTSGAGAYTNGQIVTVIATPNGCYDFVKWTIGARSSTANPYTFAIGDGEELVANFQLKEDAITTSSSPAKGGKTTGKGAYGCGATVKVTATAAPGYKFNGWTVDGSPVSRLNPYSFKAVGDEELTANFLDICTVSLTSPAASEKAGATLLAISGTAKDVLGVSNVVLTVGGNPVTATTTDNWTNWSASAFLSPGSNVIAAYALSQAGNPSKTNTITVTDTNASLAPSSMAGLIAQIELGANAPFQASFGTATFEQLSADAAPGSAVGNYTYALTGSNTATLVMAAFAPPNQAGQGSSAVYLTFISPNFASFTNAEGQTATFIVFAGLPGVITPPAGRTSYAVDAASGATNTTIFGDGTLTIIDNLGATSTGTYVFAQYGPEATMLVETYTDPDHAGNYITNYVLDRHTSPDQGNYFATSFASFDGSTASHFGAFTSTYQATGKDYLAPDSLNGVSAKFSPHGQSAFDITFGQATFGQTVTSTNATSGVADYAYTRTSLDSAILTWNYLAPPGASAHNGTVVLTFKSSASADFTNSNGDYGTLKASEASAKAPLSLTGKTIVVKASGETVTVVLANDNTYVSTDRHPGGETKSFSGTYTSAQYSPDVVMLTLLDTPSEHTGELNYIQLTFSAAASGSLVNTIVDVNPASVTVATATFTIE